jgi:hypothetical protein
MTESNEQLPPADEGRRSSDGLGLLPLSPHDHPDPQMMVWSEQEIQAIRRYAAACVAAERSSRGMFVARLENMQKSGDQWLTVHAVLALLNDCDMLASRSISCLPNV